MILPQTVATCIEKGFHTAEASYMAGNSSQKVTDKHSFDGEEIEGEDGSVELIFR